MKRKSISVAMAAYNGEKYIRQQLESIVSQLSQDDEIVISLDPSQDNTQAIIESFQDSRIHLIQGPGKGLISNFENAILHTTKDIIFLCDQDDIWLDGKVNITSYFEQDVQVVLHDAKIVDSSLNVLEPSFFQSRKVSLGIQKNIIKNSYMGCCMAFRKELKEHILPFPKSLPMHDQWIGLVGEKVGKNVFVDTPYVLYRRHGENESSLSHASISQMIKWRVQILRALSSI